MRIANKLGSTCLLIFLTLVACGPSQAELDAEGTKADTDTKTEQMTETPVDTLTQKVESTSSPTVKPTLTLVFNEYEDIEHGGFRYRKLEGFRRTYLPAGVNLSSDDREILITLDGSLVPEGMTVEEAVENWIPYMAESIADFRHSEIFPYKMVGLNGFRMDFQGRLSGEHVIGYVAIVYHDGETGFEVVASAPDERWMNEGEDIVNQILQTVEVFALTPMENFCPISSDSTYGYRQENPIRVGSGNPLEGPILEQEYLEGLRGPQGQSIDYIRKGSINVEDTILDIYEITIENVSGTLTLYFDMYDRHAFVIPQGFSCAWSFE